MTARTKAASKSKAAKATKATKAAADLPVVEQGIEVTDVSIITAQAAESVLRPMEEYKFIRKEFSADQTTWLPGVQRRRVDVDRELGVVLERVDDIVNRVTEKGITIDQLINNDRKDPAVIVGLVETDGKGNPVTDEDGSNIITALVRSDAMHRIQAMINLHGPTVKFTANYVELTMRQLLAAASSINRGNGENLKPAELRQTARDLICNVDYANLSDEAISTDLMSGWGRKNVGNQRLYTARDITLKILAAHIAGKLETLTADKFANSDEPYDRSVSELAQSLIGKLDGKAGDDLIKAIAAVVCKRIAPTKRVGADGVEKPSSSGITSNVVKLAVFDDYRDPIDESDADPADDSDGDGESDNEPTEGSKVSTDKFTGQSFAMKDCDAKLSADGTEILITSSKGRIIMTVTDLRDLTMDVAETLDEMDAEDLS